MLQVLLVWSKSFDIKGFGAIGENFTSRHIFGLIRILSHLLQVNEQNKGKQPLCFFSFKIVY